MTAIKTTQKHRFFLLDFICNVYVLWLYPLFSANLPTWYPASVHNTFWQVYRIVQPGELVDTCKDSVHRQTSFEQKIDQKYLPTLYRYFDVKNNIKYWLNIPGTIKKFKAHIKTPFPETLYDLSIISIFIENGAGF